MADRAKLVAALDYLSRIDETMKNLQSGAKQFGAGVIDNLTGRAKDLGGLIYEAGTSDPSMERMNTAEFSQAAAQRPQTPNLDQMWGDLGTMGKAIVTQPIQTGKAIVQGEVERAKEATRDPRAAGNYAGSFIDPMRLAKALRARPSMRELDAWHGSPHRFPPTEANPLGEFDSSKIGTGEGAQAYGHGTYLAEAPIVAKGYAINLANRDLNNQGRLNAHANAQRLAKMTGDPKYAADDLRFVLESDPNHPQKKLLSDTLQMLESGDYEKPLENMGSLYKVDLPDEMIDRMLDWDKPLSEQHPQVLAAMGYHNQPRDLEMEAKAIYGTPEYKNLEKLMDTRVGSPAVPDVTGGEWYRSTDELLRGSAANDAARSAYLRSIGIPGIKYLDAGSRTAQSSGTRNFVVFPGEEKKVKILERK